MEERVKELEEKVSSLESYVKTLENRIDGTAINFNGEKIIKEINSCQDRIKGNRIEVSKETLIEDGVIKRSHLANR